ncbi:MAG: DUF4175 domain-containing protein, partial [Alphaproteobacteria bacterium]|nr:DUF4175 domain-containing protein [Alphaproteobacteria bacterium]
MSTTLDKGTIKDRKRLARKRRLTAFILLSESLTATFWRIGSWLCLFFGLWLLQIPSMFGHAGPGIALAVFIIGLVWFIRKDIKHLRWPARNDIDRRLESAGGLPHRPLEIIDDQLANSDTAPARRLWQVQKHNAFTLISALRLPLPRALLAKRDPYGLRIAAVLLLVIGLVAAGPQAANRITHGMMPYNLKLPGPNLAYLTLWITPPEYTAQPRLTLQGAGSRKETLTVPAGSVVKARINSRFGQPVLHMGERDIPMEALDKKSWGIEIPVEPGEALRITQMGIPRATIPYKLIPDNPPTITMTEDVKIMEKAELQFALKLNDDYGVTEMTMNVELDPMVEDKPLGAPFSETRAVMSAPHTDHDMRPLYDLGWHPWAGLPAIITFTARDHLGQETVAEPVKMVLPERTFKHPVAAALVELR